jgi:integrase
MRAKVRGMVDLGKRGWQLGCVLKLSLAKEKFIIAGLITAQNVFRSAKQKAGIKKDVSFHCLRHSLATHLLEKGIDIRYIKDILGHFNITTTERYVHVRRGQLVQIKSPLDWLRENGGIEW